MTTKKSTKRVALLTALVLITSLFLGISVARYVTNVGSEDEARVAKWGFSETAEPVTMDLFKNEYKLEDNTVVAKSNDDADIIAPGLNGVSKFKFVTSSVEPEVMYEVKISVDDSEIAPEIKNHPGIQWKVDNGNWVTWDEMVASLVSLSGDASGTKVYAPGELHNNFKSNVEHTIAWQWLMDAGYDEEDTDMGNLAASGTPITANIVVTILAQQTDIDSTGMLEGNGSVFNTNDPQPLTFRANADYNTFSSVEVDGTTVASGNYETTPGSIKVKLKKEYLETLSIGNHKITINTTDDKSIEAKFTVTDSMTIVHNGIIPEGGTYYVGVHSDTVNAYLFPTETYVAGDKFPTTVSDGDIYVYGDYEYKYNRYSDGNNGWTDQNPNGRDVANGWGVSILDKTKTTYGNILSSINGKDVKSIRVTFANCENLLSAPIIPKTIIDMGSSFANCFALTTAPIIPEKVKDISGVFSGCNNLSGTVTINSNDFNAITRALLGTNVTWIDGSISEDLKQAIATDSGITLTNPNEHSGIIPNGGKYYTQVTGTEVGNISDYAMMLSSGSAFPDNPMIGDVYLYNGYEYKYGYKKYAYDWVTNEEGGWGVSYNGIETSPTKILTTINGIDVKNADFIFFATGVVTAPEFPETLTSMNNAFYEATCLQTFSSVPQHVKSIDLIFFACESLKGEIEINSNNLVSYNGSFVGCNYEDITITGTISEELKEAIINASNS